MQLGPGTTSLACARLIVPFAPFSTYENTTKSAARREETSMPPMRKGAGIQ